MIVAGLVDGLHHKSKSLKMLYRLLHFLVVALLVILVCFPDGLFVGAVVALADS